MSNFKLQNINFSRQALLGKLSKPLPVLALYPTNSVNTSIYVTVTSTTIVLTFVSSAGTVNPSISYVDKSLQDVALEISALNLPIQCRVIHNISSLQASDLLSISQTKIPGEFKVYDRIDSKGVVLRSDKIAVRHKATSKIKLVLPYFSTPFLPWYPRITNGSFTQEKDGKTYTFKIPEFDNQTWSLEFGKPFRDLKSVPIIQISNNVYQLPRFPVFWNGENIALFNGDAPISSSLIEDVDVNNGILYLVPQANLDKELNIDYTYLETTYEYKYLNVNSHLTQNPTLIDKFVVFYLLPVEGNHSVRNRSVYHIIADSIEQGINSIPVPDQEMPIAILGAYNIRQLFNASDLSLLDTRSLGGGLIQSAGPKSAKLDIPLPLVGEGTEIEDLYTEAYRFWDIGNYDGESYPGSAVVKMDIPENIRDILPIDELTLRASKHLAAGVYPSLDFSNRPLPSVTGNSSQISAAYNLDFSEKYIKETTSTKAIPASIPSTYEGAGWLFTDVDTPNSIFDETAWVNFSISSTVTGQEERYLQVDKDSSIYMPYLRSSSKVGISWEERDVNISIASGENDVLYSSWTKKTTTDLSTVETGKVEKRHFVLSSETITKQYKNFQLNAPFITGDLEAVLYNELDSIITNILDLQVGQSNTQETTFGTEIATSYGDVTNKSTKTSASDYLMASPLYTSLFKIDDTPLELKYTGELDKIGKDFIAHGTYDSGHYIKPYSVSSNNYTTVSNGSYTFNFNSSLTTIADYLSFKDRRNIWDTTANTGAFVSSSLVKTLENNLVDLDTLTLSEAYSNAYPSSWTWSAGTSSFSGVPWPSAENLGNQLSEITSSGNYDYNYLEVFAPFMSSTLAASGQAISDSNLLSVYSGLFENTLNSTIQDNDDSINRTRTRDGFDIPSNWYIGHNRAGLYLGNTVKHLIEGYEYLQKHLVSRENITDISQPAGASLNDLNTLFGWIEQILDQGYDVVYHNLLRGGITEPEIANTIFGYGWYLNNWKTNYGLLGKTYTNKFKTKFVNLFDFGLKQVCKNLFNSSSDFIETTTVNGDPGPFAADVPTKFLLPLAEAVKYDRAAYAGIAEALVNNLKNSHSQSGLYYADPFKSTNVPGNLEEIMKGYTRMYRYLASTGTFNTWEPFNTDLEQLRSTEFLPQFDSYTSDPVAGWDGVKNTISFWKYYNTGDVETSVEMLKSYGINAIEVPLDYMYWRQESGEFIERLDHLYSTCLDNKLRIVPILFDGADQGVASGDLSGYVNDYGFTGGRYYYEDITGQNFMYGAHSGEAYVNTLLSGYDNNPATLAWSIVRKPVNNAQALVNYNTIAYEIKDQTTTPVIYNIDKNLSLSEFQSVTSGLPELGLYTHGEPVNASDSYNLVSPLYNPNYDFIGIQPDSLFDKFATIISGSLETSDKKLIITNQGDGEYADYAVTLDNIEKRNLPFGLSNLFVVSGEEYGILYSDSKARNARQLKKLVDISISDGVEVSGKVDQEKLFTNKYFYQTGYFPSTTSEEVVFALSAWGTRPGFSPSDSGSLYTQVQLLERVHRSLDTLNYASKWTTGEYYVPTVLSEVDCSNLDYYASTWSGVNVFDSQASYYLTGSEIDYDKYNRLIYDWGTFLYSLYLKL